MDKVIFLVFLLLSVGVANAGDSISTDRYTKIRVQASQAQLEPLDVVVQVKFPASILDTHSAINYVLDDSGYSLIPESLWTEEMRIMLSNSLAAIHRDMTGTPLKIADVLKVLSGKHFTLVRDPLRRKVNFVLRDEYRGLIDG